MTVRRPRPNLKQIASSLALLRRSEREEKFDTIYWNLPFIYVAEGFHFQTIGERALFDPGYKTIKRFLGEAPSYLNRNGRIIVGFGDFGNYPLLRTLCQEQRLIAKRI